MEFIIGNYMIFIVIAIVLLLGLFGYMMDRKKYEEYREEILNENRAMDSLNSAPSVVNNVAAPITMQEEVVSAPVIEQAPIVEPAIIEPQTVTPTPTVVQTKTIVTQNGGQN